MCIEIYGNNNILDQMRESTDDKIIYLIFLLKGVCKTKYPRTQITLCGAYGAPLRDQQKESISVFWKANKNKDM